MLILSINRFLSSLDYMADHASVIGQASLRTHPRDFLKKLEQPEDPEAHGYNKKVMRYSSTYRHTGLIGH